MKVQKGVVSYQGNKDIVCLFGVTDDGKQYYFLDATDQKKLKNGARIATTALVEAVDPMVKASHIGVIDENGKEIIPFVNRTIRPIDDNSILVEPASPVSQSVIDANTMRSDPLAATKLVSTPALIKDKINQKMGSNGRYIYNDQFSEATIYDINGNNLLNGEYYSFIGAEDLKLYCSKNTVDSEVTECSISPQEVKAEVAQEVATPEVEVKEEANNIDVSNVEVSADVVENAMTSENVNQGFTGTDVPNIALGDDQVVEATAETPVAETQEATTVEPIAPPVVGPTTLTGMFADPAVHENETANDGFAPETALTGMFADPEATVNAEVNTGNELADMVQETTEPVAEKVDAKVNEKVETPVDVNEFAIPTITEDEADLTKEEVVEETMANEVSEEIPEIEEDKIEEETTEEVENKSEEETTEEVEDKSEEEATEEIEDKSEETTEEVEDKSEETTEEVENKSEEETSEEVEDKSEEEATEEVEENKDEDIKDIFAEEPEEETKEEISDNTDEIVEDSNIDLDDTMEESDLDNMFNSALGADTDENIFSDSMVKTDSIEFDDEFDNSLSQGSYSDMSTPTEKDNIMADVAKSMTKLMRQNRELKASLTDSNNKVEQISASRRTIAEKAKMQEQKISALATKIRSLENSISKLETKNQLLESKTREQERVINAQGHELSVIRPQLQGKEELQKILAEASTLLDDDNSNTYGYEDNYYSKIA